MIGGNVCTSVRAYIQYTRSVAPVPEHMVELVLCDSIRRSLCFLVTPSGEVNVLHYQISCYFKIFKTHTVVVGGMQVTPAYCS